MLYRNMAASSRSKVLIAAEQGISPFCRNPSDRLYCIVFAELELQIQNLVNAMRGRIVNGCYL